MNFTEKQIIVAKKIYLDYVNCNTRIPKTCSTSNFEMYTDVDANIYISYNYEIKGIYSMIRKMFIEINYKGEEIILNDIEGNTREILEEKFRKFYDNNLIEYNRTLRIFHPEYREF